MSDIENPVVEPAVAEAPKSKRQSKQAEPDAAQVSRRPSLVVRWGRGRLGGSGYLLTLIQRAKHQGRPVQPIDGDLKGRTLQTYYPPGVDGGALIPDGRDVAAFKELLIQDLDRMAEDHASRVVDTSGGARDMDEVFVDLDLGGFCETFDINLLAACMLGPDPQDFQHLLEAVDAGNLRPEHMLIVMNEGVLLRGGSPKQALLATLKSPEMKALADAGAKTIYMRKLFCMDAIRSAGADFYQVAGVTRPDGTRYPATQVVASSQWLANFEEQYTAEGLAERLP